MASFFSVDEFRDMLLAVFVLTVIFTYPSISFLPSAFIAVAISFFFTKIAQKLLAKRYGVNAQFKLWPFGNIMSIILMFIPVLNVAMSGSTTMYPYRFGRWKRRYAKWSRFTEMTYREIGIATAAGPAMNLFLAIFSWIVMEIASPGNIFLSFFAMVNAWLALSSLFPIKPLDGAKVFLWKPWLWLLMTSFSIIILFYTVPNFI